MSGHAATETFRQLARIVKIDDVIPHPNADRLSIAIIGGWQVCIKLDEYEKGDLALYCEIDSLVPTSIPEFAFLEERKEGLKSVGDITYSRIKTIKLRKELSQGLITPIPVHVGGLIGRVLKEGMDLTEALGVLKYEKTSDKSKAVVEVPKTWYHRLALWLHGGELPSLAFPQFLSKSEEQRIQNTSSQYAMAVLSGETFEKSVKLDGESMTVFCAEDDGELFTGVCSRNTEIRQEDIVLSWPRAIVRWVGALMLRNRRAISLRRVRRPGEYTGVLDYIKQVWELNTFKEVFNFGIPEFIKVHKADSYFLKYVNDNDLMGRVSRLSDRINGELFTYAIQGELIGPSICSNHEGVKENQFYVYRVYRISNNRPLEVLWPEMAKLICESIDMPYIPVLEEATTLPPTIKDALKDAEGMCYFSGNKKPGREGVVYKSLSRDFSFKVISNAYLLTED